MYAYLQGKFTYKSPALVYLDVNGLGFEVNISLNTFTHIQNLEEGKLFTYLQVKEDGHLLASGVPARLFFGEHGSDKRAPSGISFS